MFHSFNCNAVRLSALLLHVRSKALGPCFSLLFQVVGKSMEKPSATGVAALDLARVGDLDLLAGLAGLGSNALDVLDDVLALDDLAEDDVLSVKPRAGNGGNEELGAVGVLAGVGHGEEERLGVLELEVLIGELLAIDGLSTSSVVVGKVTTLEHELGNDTVEDGVLEAVAVLTSAELAEVPCGLWGNAVLELEHNLAGGLATNGDIEEDLGHCFS